MAATMIDYAILCRAIDDWKAGRQPSAVPAAPQRIATRPAEEEEAVVEYSAMYDTNEPAAAVVPDSTQIYQMPEYEDGEVEGETEVETDVEDADAEADVEDEDDDNAR